MSNGQQATDPITRAMDVLTELRTLADQEEQLALYTDTSSPEGEEEVTRAEAASTAYEDAARKLADALGIEWEAVTSTE